MQETEKAQGRDETEDYRPVVKDWTLWKRDGDTVSFLHPRLFSRSHSCLLIASLFLSHLFLWTSYDSGFVFFPFSLVLQIYFLHFIGSYCGTSYLSIFISPLHSCRKMVRMIPPSWSLIKWLIRVFVGLAFQAELPSNPSLSSFWGYHYS